MPSPTRERISTGIISASTKRRTASLSMRSSSGSSKFISPAGDMGTFRQKNRCENGTASRLLSRKYFASSRWVGNQTSVNSAK